MKMTHSGSPSIWYNKFLSTRCVPPVLRQDAETTTDCYALTLNCAVFKELKSGNNYKIRLTFFDTQFKHFFGRKFVTTFFSCESNKILMNDVVFFHSPIKEESIVIAVEIVEVDKNDKEWVLAWTIVPIFTRSETMTDFSSNVSVPIHFKKYQLFSGTAKLLYFIDSIDNRHLVKLYAVFECCLQTNENLKTALNYIPEYVIISKSEHVAGLRRPTEGIALLRKEMPMLACSDEADTFAGILDNVTVSFGVLPEQIEGVLLETLNKERNYQLNRGPKDGSPLQVIERRLRIGIHNGFTFVEEPMIFYLSSKDEMDSRQHSLRRRSRSLSRISNFIRSEYQTFQVRNNIRLTKLLADDESAIVFAVDYLIGATNSLGNIIESNLIMVCWGAWSPFIDGSFTISDTITVPLIGGPRPNPDDVLCFKNLLRLRQKESDPFSDGKPRINLMFNFAMIGSSSTTDNQILLRIPQRNHSNSLTIDTGRRTTANPTPSPKPDFPVIPIGVVENVETEKTKDVVEKPQIVSENVEKSHGQFEPAELAPVSIRENQRKLQIFEEEFNGIDSTTIPDAYLNRPSSFPRSVLGLFNKVDFSQILDRNGNQPDFIDPTSKRMISVEKELSTRLENSEIILQFLGILNVKNSFLTANSRISKYFFTVQFYRFKLVTTERLLAHPGNEWKNNSPIALKRIDENDKILEQNGNGFMIKYTVEKNSLTTQNEKDFVQYLNSGYLFIDVWNADSLVNLGTCQIPLKCLCRQGSDAIQANLQCPVVQCGLPQDETVTALLYVKIANVGHLSNFHTEMTETQNQAIVSQRLYRLGDNRNGSFKTRARPLAAIHENALERFLMAQKLDIHQRREELFINENLQRIQEWEKLKMNTNELPKANLKRFVFEEQLEAYKSIRNESKAAKLLKTVFNAITVPHFIQNNFGKTEFFEFCLQNTFAQNIRCHVDISDPKLMPITDFNEWKYFKTMNNLKTPLENDLFEVEQDQNGKQQFFIQLNSMETVYLPFKFENNEKKNLEEDFNDVIELKVIFKRFDTGEPLSILDLTVETRNPIINAQFRWFFEECSKLNKLITIPSYGKRAVVVSSSDPSVLLQLRNSTMQEILFTTHSPTTPRVKSVLIFFFADKFRSTLLATWKIHIHAVQKLVIEGIQAQTTKIPLPLKQPEQSDALIQFHSTSEALNIFPHQPFIANSKSLSEVQGYFTPNFTGKRLALITAIDVNSRILLNSWMIHANVGIPNIVKTYEINLPLGNVEITKKRITIENQYSIPRNYRIHTSNSSVVTVEKEYHSLKPHETATIDLIFHSVNADRGFLMDIFIFVEDSDLAQQEEAYLLKITFTEN